MKKYVFIFTGLMMLSLQFINAQTNHVYLGGETVAIHGEYDGVVVSGMFEFQVDQQWINPAVTSELNIGDKIIAMEQSPVTSLDDLYDYMSINPKKNTTYEVTVERNGRLENVLMNVYYLKDEQVFKTGLYVKDEIKGIGTVTYYNPINNTYGSLGHEIMDHELDTIAEISAGDLFLASVTSIKKSTANEPGEKNSINTMIRIGDVVRNTQFGLFGYYDRIDSSKQLIEVASRQEVSPGAATMYTVINDQQIEEIDINITQVNIQNEPDIKSFKFEIIDQRIINTTGGIVQGMSGSPVVQNGKLIGAVTHMITSTPSKGYGLYIEWMLMSAESMQ